MAGAGPPFHQKDRACSDGGSPSALAGTDPLLISNRSKVYESLLTWLLHRLTDSWALAFLCGKATECCLGILTHIHTSLRF